MRVVLFLVLLAWSALASAQTQTTRYVTTTCANNGDGTAETCAAGAGLAGAYTTLANAITDGVADFADLVSANRWLDIRVGGSTADTSSPNVSGFTTDSTRYVKISAQGSDRHLGIWDTGKYRIANDYGIAINDANVWIDGLQFHVGDSDDNNLLGIDIQTDNANITISNSIFKANHTSCSSFCNGLKAIQVHVDHDGNVYVYNNIMIMPAFSGRNSYGITSTNFATGKMYAYNNTITAKYAIQDGYDDINAKNNIMVGSSACFVNNSNVETTSVGASTNYNSVSCATAVGANSRTSQTFTFVATGSDDYHLSSGDAGAKDFGTDLSADGSLAFSTDIDGATRSGTWDIGADEYTVTTNPFSVLNAMGEL